MLFLCCSMLSSSSFYAVSMLSLCCHSISPRSNQLLPNQLLLNQLLLKQLRRRRRQSIYSVYD